MIAQGTDGLSRGELSSGVMAGERFLKFLPLNESAFDRQTNLQSSVRGWLSSAEWKRANVKDWFHAIFQDTNGAWIWAPPPVLAKLAVEQMCEAKHIFPNSKHVFICPALMTGCWRKQLGKLADVMFTISAGSVLWKKTMYEPLTIAFVRPLLCESPWKASRLDRVARWRKSVSELQWDDRRTIRNHMREFWLSHEQ